MVLSDPRKNSRVTYTIKRIASTLLVLNNVNNHLLMKNVKDWHNFNHWQQ